jgi:hypothetical protein
MKTKLRCISAATYLSPKQDDTLTIYRFAKLDGAPIKEAGGWWPESPIELYYKEANQFEVGKEYYFTLEVHS